MNYAHYTLRITHYAFLVCGLTLASCIENDIPYPLVEGNITAFEVESMCDENGNEGGSATINKASRIINLNVDDRVKLSKLRITRLQVSNDARISVLDSTLCNNYAKFPRNGFASLKDLYTSSDTRVDFSNPIGFRLSTYQDYDWTVNVKQIIKRNISLDGQVGNAVIDEVSHNAVIYVSPDQNLSAIHVSEFSLAGQHGTVMPDPTSTPTFDFSGTTTFYVKHAYEETSTVWSVFVYTKEAEQTSSASLFPMSTRANVSGTAPSGQTLSIEYKRQGSATWTALNASEITRQGTKFSAVIRHLEPSTSYIYRIRVNGNAGDEQTFITAPAPQLTDGDFDNWHKVGRKWNPWAEGGTSFWDTGNQGATTVGESNSVPTDETCNGKGQATLLESKYIVVKFAAGSIFTGEYVETDGTNGILDFGRPFTGFPTALRVNYKFVTSTINRSSDKDYEYLKGQPDSCQIYIALADWDEPYRIRTRPSTRRVFNPHDPGIIAYAQMTLGDDQATWKQKDLVLDYYSSATGRTPKYILVVASASKYGDYFTGGDGTKLWIDNFELIYD